MTQPKSTSTDNPWTYEGRVVEIDTLVGFYGFVYLITDRQTGKKYIGRKYVWSYRKEKGASRRKKQESDWQDYYSSNEELKQIGKESPERLQREILHLCRSKGECNFLEVAEQIKRDVLYSDDYMNDNINRKVFQEECQMLQETSVNSYIIIQPKTVTIIEGWSSPQFNDRNIWQRTVCWFLSLLCYSGHTYPRDGFVIQQMFRNLIISNMKRAFIQVKRNPEDETDSYRIFYVSRFYDSFSAMHK
jgi:hypothetical protein